MGVCCSKKSTGVVDPLVLEVQIGNNGVSASDSVDATTLVKRKTGSREQTNLLSAPSLVLGRHERTLRARQFLPYDAHTMQKPTAPIGQPWTDETFPQVFEKDKEGKTIKLIWKRPKDFTSVVRLFGDTINRYCAKQGQVSDCFFISTLSAIADHPEYIKQIFPEDAYETDPSKYTGIVHCRFWWMGEWIDVYTDDILPCYDDLDRFVGVHSDDKNIVWAPLAEKALARLYGSYPKISGNQRDVFRLLTGGLVEDFKTSKATKDTDDFLPPDKLFERAEIALNTGSTVLTGISEEVAESQLKGLVSHHAYSVTGVLKIEHRKQIVKLLRIRNPWGEKENTGKWVNNGEWKGRWSYNSTEWKEVDETLRKQHNVNFDKGGEFWVCIDDFFKLFENLYVCDRIPNFDRDGFRKKDGLDKVITILGEWHGITSAGNEEKTKMRNPRFILSIPGQNNAKAMSVVIEITRQFEHPADSSDDKDGLFGVIDIYKIEKEEIRGNRLWMSLNKQTAGKKDIGGRTGTYLCKLSPGDHLLVPFYYDIHVKPPVSKSFCIRIFTNTNVRCSQMNQYPTAFYGDWNHSFGDKDVVASILFGEWRGETAAGNTENKMKNPKFILTVPDIGSAEQRQITLLMHLQCSQDVKKIPNSDIDVFKIEKDQPIKEQLWRSMKQIPEKEESRFIGDNLFKYELLPGNYFLLPFFYDKESITCEFCIRILSSSQVQCRPHIENPVMFVREAEDCLEFGNQSFTLGDASQPVLIALLQEKIDPIHAIACHIMQINEDHHLPVGLDVLRSSAKVKTFDDETHPYMHYSEVSGRYMLPPGRYLVLVCAAEPTDEKKFALVIASLMQSQIFITEPK